jgi:DNA repair exonuclease SbcCD ATPase subunit
MPSEVNGISVPMPEKYADAAIAELEAENKWLKERVRLTEAQFCQRAEQLEQAEAALRYMTVERDSLTEDRDDLLVEKRQAEAALLNQQALATANVELAERAEQAEAEVVRLTRAFESLAWDASVWGSSDPASPIGASSLDVIDEYRARAEEMA